MRCEVLDCKDCAVEVLVFCNPLTAGWGRMRVCAFCLADFRRDHLL
jgi:hypothetical protein